MILRLKFFLSRLVTVSKACAKNDDNEKVPYFIIKSISGELGSVKF
jgi:hypothetical protein